MSCRTTDHCLGSHLTLADKAQQRVAFHPRGGGIARLHHVPGTDPRPRCLAGQRRVLHGAATASFVGAIGDCAAKRTNVRTRRGRVISGRRSVGIGFVRNSICCASHRIGNGHFTSCLISMRQPTKQAYRLTQICGAVHVLPISPRQKKEYRTGAQNNADSADFHRYFWQIHFRLIACRFL
jgi:hypothetical protein